MKRTLPVTILLLVVTQAFAADLPDSAKTPGVALDTVPDAQAAKCLSRLTGHAVRIGQTITREILCTDKYTTCIRDVSEETKTKVYASYGLQGDHAGYCSGSQGCEVDHLVSLEIGGSNDEKNLWPQPYQGTTWNAHVKDQLEKRLQKMVCDGDIPLDQARQEISTNWIDAYKKYVTK
jgi:hypothetical protein